MRSADMVHQACHIDMFKLPFLGPPESIFVMWSQNFKFDIIKNIMDQFDTL